jgi:hypothetical protein
LLNCCCFVHDFSILWLMISLKVNGKQNYMQTDLARATNYRKDVGV